MKDFTILLLCWRWARVEPVADVWLHSSDDQESKLHGRGGFSTDLPKQPPRLINA